jgi:hypothetical protein
MVHWSGIGRIKHGETKRGVGHYVEHLADIAILGGNRGQLDGAAAGGVVRDETERVEPRLVLFLLLLRRTTPVLAARRDCRVPGSRSRPPPQPPADTAERAIARGEGNPAAAGGGFGGGRGGNGGEEEQGGRGGGRAGAAARHGGGRWWVAALVVLGWADPVGRTVDAEEAERLARVAQRRRASDRRFGGLVWARPVPSSRGCGCGCGRENNRWGLWVSDSELDPTRTNNRYKKFRTNLRHELHCIPPTNEDRECNSEN